jgi:hypothetical protein
MTSMTGMTLEALAPLGMLTDEELVARIEAICVEGHRLTARLVVHLVEVEERRLDLKAACSSMFDYCVRRLGMTESAAYRRINAARLVKKFPRRARRRRGARQARRGPTQMWMEMHAQSRTRAVASPRRGARDGGTIHRERRAPRQARGGSRADPPPQSER